MTNTSHSERKPQLLPCRLAAPVVYLYGPSSLANYPASEGESGAGRQQPVLQDFRGKRAFSGSLGRWSSGGRSLLCERGLVGALGGGDFKTLRLG